MQQVQRGGIERNVFPFDAFSVDGTAQTLILVSPWRFFSREAFTSVSADYTVLDNDGYMVINVTTGVSNRTITLPTLADNQGRFLTVFKLDSGAGEIILDGEGAETISGFSALRVGVQYQQLTVFAAPTEWKFIHGVFQPVANEPSCGTLHFHYYLMLNGADPADTDYHPCDLSAVVPVGAKAVVLTGQFYTSAACNLVFSNANGGDSYISGVASSSGYAPISGIVPLSSTRTIWYMATNTGASGVSVWVTGYFI